MGKIDINDESTWPDCQCWVHLNDGTWRKYAIPNGVIWSSRHDNGAFFHGCSWFPCGPRGWIRVEDGLPPESWNYLTVTAIDLIPEVPEYDVDKGAWFSDGGRQEETGITHWQPAPLPPVGEEGEDR